MTGNAADILQSPTGRHKQTQLFHLADIILDCARIDCQQSGQVIHGQDPALIERFPGQTEAFYLAGSDGTAAKKGLTITGVIDG